LAHPERVFDASMSHPPGVNTAREYVMHRSEHAQRAVDIMVDVVVTCARRPKPAFEAWVPRPGAL
jgi:hypothetical protein